MFVFIFPVCQMTTDVGNLWGRWKLFRNTLNSQGRFWLATAEAWWSCGIWAFVTLSSSSWANRYLLQLVLIVLAPSFQGDVIARWPAVMTVCLWPSPQQLESLVWERSGNLFVCSHNDGGYSVWAVTSGSTCNHQPVSSTIPYGEKCIHHMSHTPHICISSVGVKHSQVWRTEWNQWRTVDSTVMRISASAESSLWLHTQAVLDAFFPVMQIVFRIFLPVILHFFHDHKHF